MLRYAIWSHRTEYSPLAKAAPAGQEITWRIKETPAESNLSIKGKAYIAGIYEHPTRHAPDKSTAQLHAEIAKGAIEDAGLTKADIDGYFCAGDAPGGVMAMVDYLGLEGPPFQFHRYRRLFLSGSSRPRRRSDCCRQVFGSRWSRSPASRAPGRCRRARAARKPISRPRMARPHIISTACAPCVTCMNSAPPASNWPGSRSRPPTTRNTTRTRCCRTS